MNLKEVLDINENPLEEATLTQILNRINKHKNSASSPKELANLLSSDNALKGSLGTVMNASDSEREEFVNAISVPEISKAINMLDRGTKIAITRLAKVPGKNFTNSEKVKKTIVKGSLANMSEKDKAIIQKMQNEFIKAKSPQEKNELIGKWTSSVYNSKLFKLAKKEGII